MILPGSTIGMLGGGQLGRMFTQAARTMGYNVLVLEPDPLSPAAQLATQHFVAAYDDAATLEKFGKQCDVITTEFENIPADTLNHLTAYCPVRPSAKAVQVAQDRLAEKHFFQQCNLSPVAFAPICQEEDIPAAVQSVGFPAILKTARLGYDGKGQVTVDSLEELKTAWQQLKQVDCVLEKRIDLKLEVSVVLARNTHGEHCCYPAAENEHRNGILHQTIAPARISEALAQTAQRAAKRIADELEFIGVLAVEFFITQENELLVNEMAPRPHNSGHYTLDACYTSQFEQQLRAVCGLPFGKVEQHTPTVMVNVLGDLWRAEQRNPNWSEVLQEEGSKLHLYGKKLARPGRKMGHFCTVQTDVNTAIQQAENIFKQLTRQANH